MVRLNKRQLKKARKKRIDQLFKNYDKELTYELLSNQLHKAYTIKTGHIPLGKLVREEALKLIIEHSK